MRNVGDKAAVDFRCYTVKQCRFSMPTQHRRTVPPPWFAAGCSPLCKYALAKDPRLSCAATAPVTFLALMAVDGTAFRD